MVEHKESILKSLLEISSNKEKSVNILVDSIFDKTIDIVDATKSAKELCYSFCESICIVIIADAFKKQKDILNIGLHVMPSEKDDGFNIYRNDTKVGYVDDIALEVPKVYEFIIKEVIDD